MPKYTDSPMMISIIQISIIQISISYSTEYAADSHCR